MIRASQFIRNISNYQNPRRVLNQAGTRLQLVANTRQGAVVRTRMSLTPGGRSDIAFGRALRVYRRNQARQSLQNTGLRARRTVARRARRARQASIGLSIEQSIARGHLNYRRARQARIGQSIERTIRRSYRQNYLERVLNQNPDSHFPVNFNSRYANIVYNEIAARNRSRITVASNEFGSLAFRSVSMNTNWATTIYQMRWYPQGGPSVSSPEELGYVLSFINRAILPNGYVRMVSNLSIIGDHNTQIVRTFISRMVHRNANVAENRSLTGENAFPGLIDSPDIVIDYARSTFFVRLITGNNPVGNYENVEYPKWLSEKTRAVFMIKNRDNTCGQHLMYLMDKRSKNRSDLHDACIGKENIPEIHQKANKSWNKWLKLQHAKPTRFMKNVKKFIAKNKLHSNEMTPSELTKEYHKLHPNEDIVYLRPSTDAFHIERYDEVSDYTIRHYALILPTQKKYTNDEGHLVVENGYHFCFVKDIQVLFKRKKNNKHIIFCEDCLQYYRGQGNTHKCGVAQTDSCWCCKTKMSISQLAEHKKLRYEGKCPKCNFCCYGEECYNKHIGICKGEKWFCMKCPKHWYPKETRSGCPVIHDCENPYCSVCDRPMPKEHRCFIPVREKKDSDKAVGEFAVFDFETDPGNNHEVLQWGVKEYPTGKEIYCDQTENDKSQIEQFYDWAFQKREGRSTYTIIAHNLKGYDGQLLYHYIVKFREKRPQTLIMAGGKIMMMRFGRVRFIDSLNHLAVPLSKLPKMWGLKSLVKGDYPYEFNTRDNLNYKGKIPPLLFGSAKGKGFRPDDMKPGKRKKFMEWYKSHPDDFIWDHRAETKKYCMDDVRILYGAIQRYCELGIRVGGLNPIRSTTIASYCMDMFKTYYYDREKFPQSVLTKDEYFFIKRSFFGGRTEVFRKLVEGPTMRYEDVQSEYPAVQYFKHLPYGAPEHRKANPFDNTKEGLKKLSKTIMDLPNISKDGFFEVDIVCPKDLHIPVLPSRDEINKNTKLVFSLTDKKKAVYYGVELREALRRGYKITKFYKAILFKTTDQFFKKYIASWLEIKVNSSKRPEMSDEEYEVFKKRHEDLFGFTPNQSYNPGLRALAKLCLNSLWGKWGQRPGMPETVWLNKKQTAKYYQILRDSVNGYLSIQDMMDGMDGCIYIKYQYDITKKDKLPGLDRTNIAMCSAVTSNARMLLYGFMKDLGKRICYCDTDSVVYIASDNPKENLKLDNILGGMELEDDGIFNRFVATAPKSYAYIGDSEHTKSKGITLNHANSKLINYRTLKKLVVENENIMTERNMRFILKDSVMTTVYQPKVLKMDGDKRIFLNDYNSVPIGWGS